MKNIRDRVRQRYGTIAAAGGCCCSGGTAGGSCCGERTAAPAEPSGAERAAELGEKLGYTAAELASIPEGSNLGLGCGNPSAIGEVRPGETVLDLGSGAGIDCFLAAKKVGPKGRVIGVDMTPEMLERARGNAAAGGYDNVEFREGVIEDLPLPDGSVDVVISNCVINLSPDKPRVFREIARVLKPGGRMYVSDIVLRRPLPFFVRRSVALYTGCIAGALRREAYLRGIHDAGLVNVEVRSEVTYAAELFEGDPVIGRWVRLARRFPAARRWLEAAASIAVCAAKPAA